MTLHDDMRKLWTDHVVWTRNTITSAVAGAPDLTLVLTRLLRNQADIAQAVAPFYGQEAATLLKNLLMQHIIIAVNLVSALKARDSAKADQLTKAWFANADQLAALLSQMNGSYDLHAMLYDHLKLTADEAKAQLAGDWAASIAAFDKILPQALMMADALSTPLTSSSPFPLSNRYRG